MTEQWHGQASTTSKLFSSAVFQELARRGRSPLFSSILRDSGLQGALHGTSRVADAFETAFESLTREGFRDEYVYKSALVRKILLGRHSLKTACVLNEFRVGECKADLAILNGTSTVYEIKSERDSLVRLEKQLRHYSEVFACVYVVTAECHLKQIFDSVPAHVGIMRVNRRFQITVDREASQILGPRPVSAIFDSIRTEEARMILVNAGIEIPDVPNTQFRSCLKALFADLSPSEAHNGMVTILKKTRSQARLSGLLGDLPTSLHAAALSVPLRKLDFPKLLRAMGTNLEDAMTWG